MTRDEMWFWLCSCEGVYQPDITKMLTKFKDIEKIYAAGDDELKTAGISGLKASALGRYRSSGELKDRFGKLQKDGIRFIHMECSDYPEEFRYLDGMPAAIYVRGNVPDRASPSVGIVGARACSGYGREKASEFARALAEAGVQTVSGLAAGIDAISARAAILAGGKTFAVLGCGVDVIYPRDNIDLYYDIIMHGGGIISEYPPGTRPLAWQFPHRNRLITALSDRLIVVEAGRRSGTLSTAGHALDQGREVYAVPGRSIDRLSEGCNRLIADGAGMLLDIYEFIDELYASPRWERNAVVPWADTAAGNVLHDPGGAAGIILAAFGSEPVDTDKLQKSTGMDTADLMQHLAELELSGYIMRLPGNIYARNVLR